MRTELFFSDSTARTHEQEAMSRGDMRFQAGGWHFYLFLGASNWGLEAKFIGTKKQRQNMRFVLADVVKAFTGLAGKFEVSPHEGGHRFRWARTDLSVEQTDLNIEQIAEQISQESR